MHTVSLKGIRGEKLNQSHLIEKVALINETEIIKATSIEEAQRKFTENIFRKYAATPSDLKTKTGKRSPDFYTTEIDTIDFLDTFEETSALDAKPTTMFLRAASPIEYNFTTHEKQFLKNDGFCVEDN